MDVEDHRWEYIAEPAVYYHYLCDIYNLTQRVDCLLDGGAIYSVMYESTLLKMMNHALEHGFWWDDPEWPVKNLQHWGYSSHASSVGGNDDLDVLGIAAVELSFHGVDWL